MCPVKGEKITNLIEGSKVEIIDNCGHMMLLKADRVLKVLKNFILLNYPAPNN